MELSICILAQELTPSLQQSAQSLSRMAPVVLYAQQIHHAVPSDSQLLVRYSASPLSRIEAGRRASALVQSTHMLLLTEHALLDCREIPQLQSLLTPETDGLLALPCTDERSLAYSRQSTELLLNAYVEDAPILLRTSLFPELPLELSPGVETLFYLLCLSLKMRFATIATQNVQPPGFFDLHGPAHSRAIRLFIAQTPVELMYPHLDWSIYESAYAESCLQIARALQIRGDYGNAVAMLSQLRHPWQYGRCMETICDWYFSYGKPTGVTYILGSASALGQFERVRPRLQAVERKQRRFIALCSQLQQPQTRRTLYREFGFGFHLAEALAVRAEQIGDIARARFFTTCLGRLQPDLALDERPYQDRAQLELVRSLLAPVPGPRALSQQLLPSADYQLFHPGTNLYCG